ncbi:MAG: M23 family metallopeptidase, partial [Pseudomonadota bacterium]
LNMMTVAARNMPFATPVEASYRQTSGFGPRRDPINRRTRMHNGLDFAARTGTPILAPADGTVVSAERQRGFGNLIKIRHDFGYETLYAHLSRIRVKVGDRVTRGDRIGDMGSTGRSTGSHLHYEVHLDGKPVDPLNYLKAARNVL